VLEGRSIYGSRVGTTLDLPLQQFAENAVARGIERLESGFPWIRHRDPRLVGCRDYQASQFNRVTLARRQAGSAFKPFVYLAALRPRDGVVPALTGVAVLRPWTAVVALAVLLAGCATARGPVGVPPPKAPPDAVQTGEASWYGERHQGRRTASGEVYDMHRLTAAHPALPFGTLVLVTNLQNGRSVQVRVNDRGPTVAGRIIDLSYAAARALGAVAAGTIPVSVRVLSTPP